jgi:hypothetical protein
MVVNPPRTFTCIICNKKTNKIQQVFIPIQNKNPPKPPVLEKQWGRGGNKILVTKKTVENIPVDSL